MSDTRLVDALVIRRAERDDLATIVRLLADDPLGAQREQVAEPVPEVYVRAFEAMRASEGNEMVVAVLGGEIVGCLQLIVIPGLSHQGLTRGQIESVRVARRMRGRGIGTRLVEVGLEHARAAGCGIVQLTSHASRTDAHRFYERFGFAATHVGMKRTL